MAGVVGGWQWMGLVVGGLGLKMLKGSGSKISPVSSGP